MSTPCLNPARKEKMVEISKEELDELRAKAQKWDKFTKKQASHLNAISSEEKKARAKRAAEARWKNRKENT